MYFLAFLQKTSDEMNFATRNHVILMRKKSTLLTEVPPL
jgi:hypothetical protein